MCQSPSFSRFGGGVVLGTPPDLHAPAAGNNLVALGDAFGSIVGAFGVNVWPEEPDKLADIRLVKDDHRIDVCKRRQNLGAFVLRDSRTSCTLQRPGARIGIYSDNQPASELLCSMKIADVTDVEQIEAAVGENDFFTGGTPLLSLFGDPRCVKDFWVCRRQSALHYGAQQFGATNRSGAALHHHDAAGVVGEPRGGFRLCACGQGSRVGGDYGISSARNVRYFI